MGYYTQYELEVSPDDGTTIPALRAACDEAQYALNDSGGGSDSTKWYEHESDLKEFSKTRPDVLFTLHGEGEEAGDFWNKYFKNGKVQIEKIDKTLPPFDESKLK